MATTVTAEGTASIAASGAAASVADAGHSAVVSDDVSGASATAGLLQLSSAASGGPWEHRFSPYVNNGGTVACVAGPDFAVAIADTRLAVGYSILSRCQSKITQLTDKVVLATSGMQADKTTLHNLLKIRIEQYIHQHRHQPSLTAVAQLLCTMLYSRRFFPFYTFNVLCGINDEGKGVVYSYDAIGSFEPSPYSCSGTGSQLLMPVLDCQIGRPHQEGEKPPLTKERVLEIVRSAMAAAGERDIFTDAYEDVQRKCSGWKNKPGAARFLKGRLCRLQKSILGATNMQAAGNTKDERTEKQEGTSTEDAEDLSLVEELLSRTGCEHYTF